jgi:trigger factor
MKSIEKKLTDSTVQLSLTIEKNDYVEKVDKGLKEARKNMTLKGFRAGKVPMGVVKKMYGQAILSEEIGKLVDEGINKHIEEKKYKLIGQAIPAKDSPAVDFVNDEEFTFEFEIGISPDIKLDLSDKRSFDYYEITSDNDKLKEYIKDLRNQHGETIEGEKIAEKDVIIGELLEGEEKKEATIVFDNIKDEKTKKSFKGKKVGDVVKFNPLIATDSKREAALILGLTEEEIGDEVADYDFTIGKINRIKVAEINEDFFKKVFPDEEIKDEKEFKVKLWEQMTPHYETDSDAFFARTVLDQLIEETNIELPKEFLIRYYMLNNESLTEDKLNEDWEDIESSLKNQLLFNQLAEDLNVEVTREDMRAHISQAVQGMYGMGMAGMDDNPEIQSMINNIVDNVLKDEKESQRIFDEVFDLKIRHGIKEVAKAKKKKVSFSKYQDIVKIYQEEKNPSAKEEENTQENTK